MNIRGSLVAGVAFALLALPAASQTMYKSTLPDGRVVYGDRPDPAAVKVEPLTPDTAKGGIGGNTQRESEALRQRGGAPTVSADGSQDKVRAAQKALEDAEAARTAGVEPLPGERIGTAGGASRLTESYDARQRQLQDAVDRARRDLEGAQAATR